MRRLFVRQVPDAGDSLTGSGVSYSAPSVGTQLQRKDYGMKFNAVMETGGLMVGDEVTIEINAEAVKGT